LERIAPGPERDREIALDYIGVHADRRVDSPSADRANPGRLVEVAGYRMVGPGDGFLACR
jgi:hypothetical protein